MANLKINLIDKLSMREGRIKNIDLESTDFAKSVSVTIDITKGNSQIIVLCIQTLIMFYYMLTIDV